MIFFKVVIKFTKRQYELDARLTRMKVILTEPGYLVIFLKSKSSLIVILCFLMPNLVVLSVESLFTSFEIPRVFVRLPITALIASAMV